MSRGLSSAEVTASQASHRGAAPLIELNFDSGTLRLTLAPWNITQGGNTWISTGTLMSVRPVRESVGSIEGLQFSMSGLSPQVIQLAATERYRGRIVRLLKAHFNMNTNQIIDTPKAWFVGRMRQMNIVETNQQCTVDVTAEHYEAELSRPVPLRYNDADQQRLYPGDLGCQHVEKMSELKLVWPSKRALIKQ